MSEKKQTDIDVFSDASEDLDKGEKWIGRIEFQEVIGWKEHLLYIFANVMIDFAPFSGARANLNILLPYWYPGISPIYISPEWLYFSNIFRENRPRAGIWGLVTSVQFL